MKKRIFFCIAFLFLMTINLSIELNAQEMIKQNDFLNEIKNNVNTSIATIKTIENDNMQYDYLSDSILEYTEAKLTVFDTTNIDNAKKASSIGNSQIEEKVEEYNKKLEEERKRKEEEARKQAVVQELNTRAGMYGRLTIPSLGVNVALIQVSIYGNAQGVTDARDSAAYITDFSAAAMIADHNNQGFNAMKGAIPGQTKAYIQTKSGTLTYVCTSNFQGHNTGTDLTDSSGRSVRGDNAGGLLMYTCNENWQNITITYWQPA